MTATQRTIARARRRLALHRGLRALGWSLLAAAAALTALVTVLFYLGLDTPRWVYGVAGGLALAVAGTAAWLRTPLPERVAVMIDERLGLKDHLATALSADGWGDGPFVRQVRRDAEKAAASATLGRAFAVRPTRVWLGALLAVGALGLAVLDPLGLVERAALREAEARAAQAQAQKVQETLARAAEALAPRRKRHWDPSKSGPAA